MARTTVRMPGSLEQNRVPISGPMLRRIVTGVALAVLAIFTVNSLTAFFHRPTAAAPGTTASATLEAASTRLGNLLSRQTLALDAGARTWNQGPAVQPIEAAEAMLSAGGQGTDSALIIRDGVLIARAGLAARLEWQHPSNNSNEPVRAIYTGAASDGTPLVFIIRKAEGTNVWFAAGFRPERALLSVDPGLSLAIADPSGQILAHVSNPKTALAPTLNTAFGIEPSGVTLKAKAVPGRTALGGLISVSTARRPEGLIIAAAEPPGHYSLASEIERFVTLLGIFGPLFAGIALAVALHFQVRRTDEAQKFQVFGEMEVRLAVEAARCGIWEWDMTADDVALSAIMGTLFGLEDSGKVAGQHLIEKIHPEHRFRVRQALSNASAYGGFEVSFQILGGEGRRPVWLDVRGQGLGPRGRDGFRRIIGVALDVTNERLAQERATMADLRLRDAIDSVSEAFALWDRAGRLVMSNQNYLNFFSLEPRFVSPGVTRDQLNSWVANAIKRSRPAPSGVRGEREVELNDGRWLLVCERRTAEGGLVMTAAEITLSKQEEEARRLNELELEKAVANLERSRALLADLARRYEAEKLKADEGNKAKSEFLANMSHELRTPLNAINGFSEMMVSEMLGPLGNKRYKDYASDILSSGQHLLALINDILDMSKIEAGKMNLKYELLAIDDICDDALRLVRNRAESAGLVIETALDSLPEVEADYRALKQILLNLLSNAVKFTPEGGRITVRSELVPIRDDARARIALSVQDTGVGIAKDDLERLGRPFEQAENQHSKTRQGTGLGLALSKALVELHDGELIIESEQGQGTRVTVVLPISQTGEALVRPDQAA